MALCITVGFPLNFIVPLFGPLQAQSFIFQKGLILSGLLLVVIALAFINRQVVLISLFLALLHGAPGFILMPLTVNGSPVLVPALLQPELINRLFFFHCPDISARVRLWVAEMNNPVLIGSLVELGHGFERLQTKQRSKNKREKPHTLSSVHVLFSTKKTYFHYNCKRFSRRAQLQAIESRPGFRAAFCSDYLILFCGFCRFSGFKINNPLTVATYPLSYKKPPPNLCRRQ